MLGNLAVHNESPVFQSSPAIDSGILHGLSPFCSKAPPPDVGLQQVQQPCHGAEQQHSVTGAVQLDEQPVQHTQLATLPQQLCLVSPVVGGVAQGRVVAHLTQLHAFVV